MLEIEETRIEEQETEHTENNLLLVQNIWIEFEDIDNINLFEIIINKTWSNINKEIVRIE